ncbi:MAG: hypothetical protein D6720_03240 [Gammaproteobacteria bacterium]|nr:MAG: hypothetical protein D6720_03240 [Gammaproteobacteria bacterium]
MRWLIGLLLVANLVLFLWWHANRGQGTLPVRAPLPDLGELELIREASPPAPGLRAAPEASADGEMPEEAPAAPVVEVPKAPKMISASVGDEVPPGAETQAETPAAETEVVSAPQAPAAESPPPEARSEFGATEMPPQTQCWELGPFEDQAAVESLRLPANAEKRLSKAVSMREVTGFYVLIPPQPDRESAHAMVGRLKEKGVRDFWLFHSGPLKNAISLGLFNRGKNAQRRMEEIERLGFSAEVRRRERDREGVALVVKVPKSAEIEQDLQRIVGDRLRPVPCPGGESP